MSNTYTQLHIQMVFAVKYRLSMINSDSKEPLHKYITGIFQNQHHKMLQINSMPDHIHIFCGWNPAHSISDTVQLVKKESSLWVNESKFMRTRFAWQEGFGAFSYSKSHVPAVIEYIKNQEEHHRKKTFLQEYHEMLDAFAVSYDQRYIFKTPL
jgi:putative transposase